MSSDFPTGTFRFNFEQIHPPKEELVSFNNKLSMYRHAGEQSAKPDRCLLCNKEVASFCNSHSIPQFCLKTIAVKGKLKTINQEIGIDFLPYEVGLNKTGTFKLVCKH